MKQEPQVPVEEEQQAYRYVQMQNPVYHTANDPWVVRHEDELYYCWSEDGIRVRRINDLTDIRAVDGQLVWKPEEGTMYSRDLWAPELHYIDGAWYIYVAADDGANENHRMYVLKGTTQDPTDPFELVGKITDPTDRWAIDGTVMRWRGELYFIWSGWKGYVDGGQQLYIAHMSDPMTIDSERVQLAMPTYRWEVQGMPLLEGPVALTDEEKGTAMIVYSASGSWTDDYCLGQLILTGTDPMDPKSWTKTAEPLLSKAEGTYGPGHCSFVEACDGQLWVIYHANEQSGSGWYGRSCRAQPVQWDGETLTIGAPVAPGETILVPVPEEKGYVYEETTGP